MNKQFYLIGLVVVAGVFLAGCNTTSELANVEKNKEETRVSTANTDDSCKPGKVQIEGYADQGKRLVNCFVEYPGEPSRKDKSYYVVEDVCGQFTGQFVQNALGRPVVKIAPPEHDTLFNCKYYLDDTNYVMLVFEYLSIANQRKGNEEMGRKVEESERIPMRNLVVTQADGVINTIYLAFDDTKFINVQRSSGSELSNDQLISFMANIAREIKDYK